MSLSQNKSPQSTRPVAMVTGASAGIGEAFARRLAADGYDLMVVARRKDRLQDLAGHLKAAHGTTSEVIQADLTNPADLRQVEGRISARPDLALLVNNAGYGGYRPFLQLDPDRAENLIMLQVLAVTRLARAALTGMVARGQGAVINVSSQLAFSANLPSPPMPPGRAVYAASKAYVNAFTQLLHQELTGTGVRVQALCPSIVKTEFHSLMGLDTSRLGVAAMGADDVVTASLIALQRDEVLCLPALADPSLLDELDDVERRIMQQGRANVLAERYQ